MSEDRCQGGKHMHQMIFRENHLCQPDRGGTFQNIENGSQQTRPKPRCAHGICPTCPPAFYGADILACLALDNQETKGDRTNNIPDDNNPNGNQYLHSFLSSGMSIKIETQ